MRHAQPQAEIGEELRDDLLVTSPPPNNSETLKTSLIKNRSEMPSNSNTKNPDQSKPKKLTAFNKPGTSEISDEAAPLGSTFRRMASNEDYRKAPVIVPDNDGPTANAPAVPAPQPAGPCSNLDTHQNFEFFDRTAK